MIDLTNIESKTGALEALTLLLSSRQRNIKVKKEAGENGSGGGDDPLKMPRNVKIDDVDEEEKKELEKEKELKDGPEEKDSLEKNNAKKNKKDNMDSNANQSGENRDLSTLNNTKKQDTQSPIERMENDPLENPEEIDKMLRDYKGTVAAKKAEIVRAKKQKADEWAREHVPQPFEGFKQSLDRAINQQVRISRKPVDTYLRPNASYAGTKWLMPGHGHIDVKNTPIINLYFDASGSLDDDDVERGRQAVAYIQSLQNQKLLKYHEYWFAKTVGDSPDTVGGTTQAFPDILQHVKDTHATNVIIFTDDDFDAQTDFSKIEPVQVKGCVWWIWSNTIASRAKNYLTSVNKNNTFQYKL